MAGPLPARLALLLIALGLSTIAGSLISNFPPQYRLADAMFFAVDDGL